MENAVGHLLAQLAGWENPYIKAKHSSEALSTKRRCALVHQAVPEGSTALSSLHRRLSFAVHTATLDKVRFKGIFTDGGTDKALRQYEVGNMCAPVAGPIGAPDYSTSVS